MYKGRHLNIYPLGQYVYAFGGTARNSSGAIALKAASVIIEML